MTDITNETKQIFDRVENTYSDELGNCEMMLCNPAGEYYRIRITPKDLEDGSWQSDLGPTFKSEMELRIFLRGLEYAKDISVKAGTY